jgi:hypothetical protein
MSSTPIPSGASPNPRATSLASSRALRALTLSAFVRYLRAVLVLSSFALLTYYVVADPGWIGWDAAAYMHWGQEILRGRLPFVGIVDVNPPLVQFVHVAPALLARFTQLPAALVFNSWVLAWAAFSTFVVYWFLEHLAPPLSAQRKFALLFLLCFSHHFAWHQGHFGQREHFLVMALVPALLLRWARHEGHPVPRWIALCTGIAAATALAIKPQYLPACALFEACFLLRHRQLGRALGAELLGFAVVALAYGGLFAVFPVMRHEFFGYYLPLFMHGYSVYDCSFRDLFVPPEIWLAMALWPVTLFFIIKSARSPGDSSAKAEGTQRASSIALPFALFHLGCIAAYLFQHKGWGYQMLPSFVLAPLALVLAAPVDRSVSLGLAVLALVFSAQHFEGAIRGTMPELLWLGDMRQIVASNSRPGDSLAFIGTSAVGPYPMQLELGLHPASRFPWLPMLPMFYPADGGRYGCEYRRWGAGLPAERRTLEDLSADLQRSRPGLIVVEAGESGSLRPGCTASAWLSASGFVERAMASYEQVAVVPGFAIWKRRAATPNVEAPPIGSQP